VVFALQSGDFDQDGKKDILLGGNFYGVTPLLSRYDASLGLLLKGDGKGNFAPVPASESGFVADGEVRDIQFITLANGKKIALIIRNNDTVKVLGMK
jgi:enediyne biosynthesis protein E4